MLLWHLRVVSFKTFFDPLKKILIYLMSVWILFIVINGNKYSTVKFWNSIPELPKTKIVHYLLISYLL